MFRSESCRYGWHVGLLSGVHPRSFVLNARAFPKRTHDGFFAEFPVFSRGSQPTFSGGVTRTRCTHKVPTGVRRAHHGWTVQERRRRVGVRCSVTERVREFVGRSARSSSHDGRNWDWDLSVPPLDRGRTRALLYTNLYQQIDNTSL